MNAKRRILLYGNSVIIGSIGAGLRRCSQFELATLASPLNEARTLDAVQHDIVLFDLEASQPEAPFFLLQTHPTLVLIGISPGTNLVRVWNSQQLREISMQDLLELLNNEVTGFSAAPVKPSLDKK